MKEYKNPFEYEAASKLSSQQLLAYYIEDYNYTRFIHSKRNVFLVGERGTGKTMALMYHSLPVQIERYCKEKKETDLSIISIYVPCNTPLNHRREHELLDQRIASMSSEHFLILSIMDRIIHTLSQIDNLMTPGEENDLRDELTFVLNLDLPGGMPLFRSISLSLAKSNRDTQEALNNVIDPQLSLRNLFSFSSGLQALMACFRHIQKLSNSHFSIMLDDVQHFNIYQVKAMNSWISYRDNSLFSFKIATTRVEYPTLETSSAGSILEGHDFTRIDMEQPYQNKMSAFGKMAEGIISKRLFTIDVNKLPSEYFPINEEMRKELATADQLAREEAERKFPDGTSKQKNDYVYKYGRAIYFRNRSSKANLPPYSGLEVLIHMSTGVIRNLLDPCYYMYDQMYSEWNAEGKAEKPLFESIPPSIQCKIIEERSTKKWDWARSELDKTIDDCSRDDARRVYQLLDNLAILFKKRLLSDISEPRAVVFTVSNYTDELRDKLEKVLIIARKAQLIYVYLSSGKDYGRREPYYMPNRMLWPVRGLDPIGQHARVSIQASHLWAAADMNKQIPFNPKEESHEQTLFDLTE